jgi:hypothetical protein
MTIYVRKSIRYIKNNANVNNIHIHIFITTVESSAVFPLPASTRAMTQRQHASKFPAHTGAMRL